MLGSASFYKSSPKMPQTKRALSVEASPSKKRRVRLNGGVLLEEKDGCLQPNANRWTPHLVVKKLSCNSAWSVSVDVQRDQCTDMIASSSNETAGKKVPRSIKAENSLQTRRTSTRITSARASSNIKKRVKIKQEKEEEEEETEEAALPGNDTHDDVQSDESDGEMSAYEKKRLQNIQENAKFFASLGISKTKASLSKKPAKKVTKGLKRKLMKKEPLPRRPLSLRIRRMDPQGEALPPLPEPVYAEDPYVPKPSGPFDMEPINLGEDGGENPASRLFKSITGLSKSPKVSPKKVAQQPDLAQFTKTLQSLKLEHCAKVTKDRIFSVALHPTPSKIIACAGDKWGKVGVWDVESQDANDGVFLFEPHSRPVSCLQFAPSNPSKLYSCSYDGTVRCGDFERGIFDEIHTTNIDEDVPCSHFDFLSPDGTKLLVGQNRTKGYAQVVDTRLRSNNSKKFGFQLHDRYLKTVHVHPTKPEYFVTSSTDSTVALWDLRSLKEHGNNYYVSAVTHGRSISSAYFSPITGNKVVTTAYDDRIRILQVEENGNMKVQKAIKHDNHTGRWLTTFRTTWYPRREDVIVVGSMERPRRIHLMDDEGHMLHSLFDDELGSVCSINVFHRTRDVLVGGNASGRLHVFM